jgi:hypothetical protein
MVNEQQRERLDQFERWRRFRPPTGNTPPGGETQD